MKFSALVTGKDEAGGPFETRAELAFQYTALSSAEAAPRKHEVQEHFAKVDLAETANEALKLERQGKREQANRLLKQGILEQGAYVAPAVAADYENMSERMKQGMAEGDRKVSHYQTYNQKRQRGE